jgi:hypothetical protein
MCACVYVAMCLNKLQARDKQRRGGSYLASFFLLDLPVGRGWGGRGEKQKQNNKGLKGKCISE